ncbi:MAG: zinc-dependent alcohol dehydrogenase family protein [Gammaproteobacteria bacterium]|nr:zinc-dependent alcohol dehydrogenase family protein [Gammaproteobacteria bacterium]
MRAAVFDEFRGPVRIESVPDPSPGDHGVVIRVHATGLCRSDWHGWMGHDPSICTPHVPGHELAGVVEAAGSKVDKWRPGDRVTLPFVCGCGQCIYCDQGDHQVCDNQFQPGFTHWGSFAELVAVDFADTNLVRLPEAVGFVVGASLGCRFATAFRAVVDQGRVQPGQWVAVHGCGGVGLSAVMIAAASNARVIGVDIDDGILSLARRLGAEVTINAAREEDVTARIMETTGHGAHLSLDALGDRRTCLGSIACLRKRGRHVQVGLMTDGDRAPPVPLDAVIAGELELVGSHGMQAHRYGPMLDMILDGRLRPEALVADTITLEDAAVALTRMDQRREPGILVIDRF